MKRSQAIRRVPVVVQSVSGGRPTSIRSIVGRVAVSNVKVGSSTAVECARKHDSFRAQCNTGQCLGV